MLHRPAASLPLPLPGFPPGGELTVIFVHVADGQIAAEFRGDLAGVFPGSRIFGWDGPDGPRFWRLDWSQGWPAPAEVTGEVRELLARRLTDARLASQRRLLVERARLKARAKLCHSDPFEPDPMTPEARGRLKRDPVLALERSGKIGKDEVRAAREIGQVFEGLTTPYFPISKPTVRVDVSRRSIPAPRFVGCGYNALARYRAWTARLAKSIELELAIAAVVDSVSLAALDARQRWRKGKAAEVLADALRLYVRLAGWQGGAQEEGTT